MLPRKSVLSVWAFALLTFPLFGAPTDDLLGEAQTGTSQDIQQVIRSGADVNAKDFVGRTVLMLAAASNPDPEVVKILVKGGAKVNARGPQDWTALFMAAYSNPNPAVIEALLDVGANPRLRSAAGRSAYEYAKDNEALAGTRILERLRKAAR